MSTHTPQANTRTPARTRARQIAAKAGSALRECAYKVKKWASFNYDGAAPPRIVRYILVALAVILISGVFGVITARATANFGPHNATYEVTISSAITADAGPLGSLVLDSPLPKPLGVHATIGEIPEDLTAVGSTTTLQALGKDLDGYLQFFAAPSETIALVAQLLIANAIKRAIIMAIVLTGICGAVAYISGRSRRRELSYRAARATWALTALVAIAGVLATYGFTRAAANEADNIGGKTSYVFDGTALEGARITGRLSGVIDEYGGKLLDVYNENEAFYASANQALANAYDGWDANRDRTEELMKQFGVIPRGPEQDIVTMLLVSDLHCNVGMAPLITTAAEKSGATIVLNGGDTTTNGTDIERFCVDAFAKAVPEGATMVQSDGNHDSALTSEQARAAGVTVLDGEIVDVQGVRFLGDNDPRESRMGQANVLSGTETYEQAGQRLAQVSCDAAEKPDVLLIHTPVVGTTALNSGCIDYQFSGHMHTRSGPTVIGNSVQYVNASTAGAVDGQVTIGPLHGTAEMTILRFDRNSRKFIDYQLITVSPDGTATVGDREAYPDPEAAEVAGADTGVATESDTTGSDAATGSDTVTPEPDGAATTTPDTETTTPEN